MRIYFHTTPSKRGVPLNEISLRAFVNRCLTPQQNGILAASNGGARNDEHDALSLYSVSNLEGSKFESDINGGALFFPKGATFFVSFYHTELARRFAQNVFASPKLFGGMEVTDVSLQNTPEFPESARFAVASPVLIKKFKDGNLRHLTYSDADAPEVLTQTLATKLKAAGLERFAENIRVRFDRTYPNPKTKLVDVHGIKNRANVCPVIVEGSPESVAFAWDVGVGHSTGAGFGALR